MVMKMGEPNRARPHPSPSTHQAEALKCKAVSLPNKKGQGVADLAQDTHVSANSPSPVLFRLAK
jgi:hypothetical protein